MCSPTVIGLEVPSPGSLTFQTRFSFSDHFVGRPVSWLHAQPPGPRNCIQSAAEAVTAAANKRAHDTSTAERRSERFMAGILGGGIGGQLTWRTRLACVFRSMAHASRVRHVRIA